MDIMRDDIKHLEDEIGIQKETVHSLTTNKQESNDLIKEVDKLKEDINDIKVKNLEIIDTIQELVEEFDEESEEESISEPFITESSQSKEIFACQYCDMLFKGRRNLEGHIDEHVQNKFHKML